MISVNIFLAFTHSIRFALLITVHLERDNWNRIKGAYLQLLRQQFQINVYFEHNTYSNKFTKAMQKEQKTNS